MKNDFQQFHCSKLRLRAATLLMAVCAILVAQAPASAQTTATWIGGNTGLWFNSMNWSNGAPPNGSFHVIIDGDNGNDVVVDTGTSQTIAVESLNVTSGDTLNIQNNSDFILNTTANAGSGVIQNDGQINVTNAGSNTDLVINNEATLQGTGTLTLGGAANDNSRIVDLAGGDGHLTNESTINGAGQIGVNTLQLTNGMSGLIDANVSGGQLFVDPNANGMVNDGIMRASNEGELVLRGSGGGMFDNANGRIEAGDNSTVRMESNAVVVGGDLEATGDGRFVVGPSQTASIDGVSLSGRFDVENNSNLDFLGVIENSGEFNVINGGSLTDIRIAGDVQLMGGGSINLSGAANNSRIVDETGVTGHLENVDNSINGYGMIGVNRMQLTNGVDGVIDANETGRILSIDPNSNGLANEGLMRASDGGELLLDGAGGGAFDNTNGRIEAGVGSTVRLQSVASVHGGDLESIGDGRFVVGPNQNAEIADVSFTGQFDIENNTDLELFGTINNMGAFDVTNQGSLTDLQIEGNVQLTGGGTITLGGASTNSRILDEVGPQDGVLTNSDNTIQGFGSIGSNRTEIVNLGLIDANDAMGRTLTLDPRDTGSEFTNSSTMRASNGGELVLSGAGGGKFQNGGGRIEARDNSTVRLTGVAAIVGGELESFGNGRFVVGPNQNGELEDVSFSGQFDIENNTDLELKGTINNGGVFSVSNLGSFTDLLVEGSVELSGGGSIVLGGNANSSRILDETGVANGVLTNIDNSIFGRGNIGSNRTEVVNSGIVDANDSAGTLTLDPRDTGSQFTNTGTMRASGGGELILEGSGGGKFLNAGGRIEALAGSTVRLQNVAAVVGGELESFGGGRFVVGPNQNAELEDVSFVGQFDVENNTDLELKGAINNSGEFHIANLGSFTDVQVEGLVSLTGGGTWTLGGVANTSRILDESGSIDGVLTNVDNTIQGFGQIGANRMGLVNQMGGTISANVDMATLELNVLGTEFANDGLLNAVNGGTLEIQDRLTNNGTMDTGFGSLISVTDELTNAELGSLVGNGTIEATMIFSDGRIAPGSSVGELTLDSSLMLGETSLLDVEIDALGSDLLNVMGLMSLDGDLSVELLSGFLPAETDTFILATSEMSIEGIFDNVGNGGLLETLGGRGTFVVDYGSGSAFDGSSIVLSDFPFTGVPEPATGRVLLVLMGVRAMRRRRVEAADFVAVQRID